MNIDKYYFIINYNFRVDLSSSGLDLHQGLVRADTSEYLVLERIESILGDFFVGSQ
jgi:hypothetical protein